MVVGGGVGAVEEGAEGLGSRGGGYGSGGARAGEAAQRVGREDVRAEVDGHGEGVPAVGGSPGWLVALYLACLPRRRRLLGWIGGSWERGETCVYAMWGHLSHLPPTEASHTYTWAHPSKFVFHIYK